MNNKFIIKNTLALRSFLDIKYAFIYKNETTIKYLTEDEFTIAKLCDGRHSFSDDEIKSDSFQMLLKRGYIKEANPEDCLSMWQLFKVCNNHRWPIIDLRLTEKCNYNCPHCFNAKDVNTNNDEWSYEEYLKLLDDAEKCGVVGFSFTGGEPMLHPHFLDFVKELYKRGMFLRRLMTNGRYITREILDEFKAIGCNPTFQVSFDGLESHDFMRGSKGATEKTIEAIKLIVEYGFNILVNTQVNKKTISNLLKTAEYLDEVGVNSMRLIRTSETPRWQKLSDNATLDSKEYYDFFFDFIRQYYKNNHKMSIVGWKIGNFNSKNKSYRLDACTNKVKHYRNDMYLCSTCSQEICIGANGNIYPCHQASGLADAQGVFYGNAKTQGLQAAINSEIYIKDALITSGEVRINSKECSKCKHFYQCLGGCRMYSKFILGDVYKASPFSCEFYDGGYIKNIEEILCDWENECPIEELDNNI